MTTQEAGPRPPCKEVGEALVRRGGDGALEVVNTYAVVPHDQSRGTRPYADCHFAIDRTTGALVLLRSLRRGGRPLPGFISSPEDPKSVSPLFPASEVVQLFAVANSPKTRHQPDLDFGNSLMAPVMWLTDMGAFSFDPPVASPNTVSQLPKVLWRWGVVGSGWGGDLSSPSTQRALTSVEASSEEFSVVAIRAASEGASPADGTLSPVLRLVDEFAAADAPGGAGVPPPDGAVLTVMSGIEGCIHVRELIDDPEEGTVFLVAEPVDGVAVGALDCQGRLITPPPPEAVIREVAKGVIATLLKLHRSGIVVRTLVPETVFVTTTSFDGMKHGNGGGFPLEWSVRTTLCGIDSSAKPPEGKMLLPPRSAATTVWFALSPEEVIAQHTVGKETGKEPRSGKGSPCTHTSEDATSDDSTLVDGSFVDVYALGVLLFTLACGRVPYSSQAIRRTVAAHERGAGDEFPRLEFPPNSRNMSRSLKKLLTGLLAPDPAARLSLPVAAESPWLRDEQPLASLARLPSVSAAHKRSVAAAPTSRRELDSQHCPRTVPYGSTAGGTGVVVSVASGVPPSADGRGASSRRPRGSFRKERLSMEKLPSRRHASASQPGLESLRTLPTAPLQFPSSTRGGDAVAATVVPSSEAPSTHVLDTSVAHTHPSPHATKFDASDIPPVSVPTALLVSRTRRSTPMAAAAPASAAQTQTSTSRRPPPPPLTFLTIPAKSIVPASSGATDVVPPPRTRQAPPSLSPHFTSRAGTETTDAATIRETTEVRGGASPLQPQSSLVSPSRRPPRTSRPQNSISRPGREAAPRRFPYGPPGPSAAERLHNLVSTTRQVVCATRRALRLPPRVLLVDAVGAEREPAAAVLNALVSSEDVPGGAVHSVTSADDGISCAKKQAYRLVIIAAHSMVSDPNDVRKLIAEAHRFGPVPFAVITGDTLSFDTSEFMALIRRPFVAGSVVPVLRLLGFRVRESAVHTTCDVQPNPLLKAVGLLPYSAEDALSDVGSGGSGRAAALSDRGDALPSAVSPSGGHQAFSSYDLVRGPDALSFTSSKQLGDGGAAMGDARREASNSPPIGTIRSGSPFSSGTVQSPRATASGPLLSSSGGGRARGSSDASAHPHALSSSAKGMMSDHSAASATDVFGRMVGSQVSPPGFEGDRMGLTYDTATGLPGRGIRDVFESAPVRGMAAAQTGDGFVRHPLQTARFSAARHGGAAAGPPGGSFVGEGVAAAKPGSQLAHLSGGTGWMGVPPRFTSAGHRGLARFAASAGALPCAPGINSSPTRPPPAAAHVKDTSSQSSTRSPPTRGEPASPATVTSSLRGSVGVFRGTGVHNGDNFPVGGVRTRSFVGSVGIRNSSDDSAASHVLSIEGPHASLSPERAIVLSTPTSVPSVSTTGRIVGLSGFRLPPPHAKMPEAATAGEPGALAGSVAALRRPATDSSAGVAEQGGGTSTPRKSADSVGPAVLALSLPQRRGATTGASPRSPAPSLALQTPSYSQHASPSAITAGPSVSAFTSAAIPRSTSTGPETGSGTPPTSYADGATGGYRYTPPREPPATANMKLEKGGMGALSPPLPPPRSHRSDSVHSVTSANVSPLLGTAPPQAGMSTLGTRSGMRLRKAQSPNVLSGGQHLSPAGERSFALRSQIGSSRTSAASFDVGTFVAHHWHLPPPRNLGLLTSPRRAALTSSSAHGKAAAVDPFQLLPGKRSPICGKDSHNRRASPARRSHSLPPTVLCRRWDHVNQIGEHTQRDCSSTGTSQSVSGSQQRSAQDGLPTVKASSSSSQSARRDPYRVQRRGARSSPASRTPYGSSSCVNSAITSSAMPGASGSSAPLTGLSPSAVALSQIVQRQLPSAFSAASLGILSPATTPAATASHAATPFDVRSALPWGAPSGSYSVESLGPQAGLPGSGRGTRQSSPRSFTTTSPVRSRRSAGAPTGSAAPRPALPPSHEAGRRRKSSLPHSSPDVRSRSLPALPVVSFGPPLFGGMSSLVSTGGPSASTSVVHSLNGPHKVGKKAGSNASSPLEAPRISSVKSADSGEPVSTAAPKGPVAIHTVIPPPAADDGHSDSDPANGQSLASASVGASFGAMSASAAASAAGLSGGGLYSSAAAASALAQPTALQRVAATTLKESGSAGTPPHSAARSPAGGTRETERGAPVAGELDSLGKGFAGPAGKGIATELPTSTPPEDTGRVLDAAAGPSATGRRCSTDGRVVAVSASPPPPPGAPLAQASSSLEVRAAESGAAPLPKTRSRHRGLLSASRGSRRIPPTLRRSETADVKAIGLREKWQKTALRGHRMSSETPSRLLPRTDAPPLRAVRKLIMTKLDDRQYINEYQVIDPHFARGAQSVVMLVEDPRKAIFVVKRIARAKCQNLKTNNIKRLAVPHVVRIVEVIDDPDSDFVYHIMEYAAGGAIAEASQTDGTLSRVVPTENALRVVARELLHGLVKLHSRWVALNDIKVENVLLTATGRALLSDFGSAAFFENENDFITHSQYARTLQYTPPEVFENQQYASKTADVWSYGVTLYALWYGRLPFFATVDKELYSLIIKGDIDYPEYGQAGEKTSPALVRFLQQCLHADYLARPQSIALLNDAWLRSSTLGPYLEVVDAHTLKERPCTAEEAAAAGLGSTPPPEPSAEAVASMATLTTPPPSPCLPPHERIAPLTPRANSPAAVGESGRLSPEEGGGVSPPKAAVSPQRVASQPGSFFHQLQQQQQQQQGLQTHPTLTARPSNGALARTTPSARGTRELSQPALRSKAGLKGLIGRFRGTSEQRERAIATTPFSSSADAYSPISPSTIPGSAPINALAFGGRGGRKVSVGGDQVVTPTSPPLHGSDGTSLSRRASVGSIRLHSPQFPPTIASAACASPIPPPFAFLATPRSRKPLQGREAWAKDMGASGGTLGPVPATPPVRAASAVSGASIPSSSPSSRSAVCRAIDDSEVLASRGSVGGSVCDHIPGTPPPVHEEGGPGTSQASLSNVPVKTPDASLSASNSFSSPPIVPNAVAIPKIAVASLSRPMLSNLAPVDTRAAVSSLLPGHLRAPRASPYTPLTTDYGSPFTPDGLVEGMPESPLAPTEVGSVADAGGTSASRAARASAESMGAAARTSAASVSNPRERSDVKRAGSIDDSKIVPWITKAQSSHNDGSADSEPSGSEGEEESEEGEFDAGQQPFILVVDDHYVFRVALVEHISTLLGGTAVIDEAASGEVALEKFVQTFEKFGRGYDVIFMDYFLPGERQGDDTIRTLREMEAAASLEASVIAIVTSCDCVLQAKLRDEQKSIGYDFFLVKPSTRLDIAEVFLAARLISRKTVKKLSAAPQQSLTLHRVPDAAPVTAHLVPRRHRGNRRLRIESFRAHTGADSPVHAPVGWTVNNPTASAAAPWNTGTTSGRGGAAGAGLPDASPSPRPGTVVGPGGKTLGRSGPNDPPLVRTVTGSLGLSGGPATQSLTAFPSPTASQTLNLMLPHQTLTAFPVQRSSRAPGSPSPVTRGSSVVPAPLGGASSLAGSFSGTGTSGVKGAMRGGRSSVSMVRQSGFEFDSANPLTGFGGPPGPEREPPSHLFQSARVVCPDEPRNPPLACGPARGVTRRLRGPGAPTVSLASGAAGSGSVVSTVPGDDIRSSAGLTVVDSPLSVTRSTTQLALEGGSGAAATKLSPAARPRTTASKSVTSAAHKWKRASTIALSDRPDASSVSSKTPLSSRRGTTAPPSQASARSVQTPTQAGESDTKDGGKLTAMGTARATLDSPVDGMSAQGVQLPTAISQSFDTECSRADSSPRPRVPTEHIPRLVPALAVTSTHGQHVRPALGLSSPDGASAGTPVRRFGSDTGSTCAPTAQGQGRAFSFGETTAATEAVGIPSPGGGSRTSSVRHAKHSPIVGTASSSPLGAHAGPFGSLGITRQSGPVLPLPSRSLEAAPALSMLAMASSLQDSVEESKSTPQESASHAVAATLTAALTASAMDTERQGSAVPPALSASSAPVMSSTAQTSSAGREGADWAAGASGSARLSGSVDTLGSRADLACRRPSEPVVVPARSGSMRHIVRTSRGAEAATTPSSQLSRATPPELTPLSPTPNPAPPPPEHPSVSSPPSSPHGEIEGPAGPPPAPSPHASPLAGKSAAYSPRSTLQRAGRSHRPRGAPPDELNLVQHGSAVEAASDTGEGMESVGEGCRETPVSPPSTAATGDVVVEGPAGRRGTEGGEAAAAVGGEGASATTAAGPLAGECSKPVTPLEGDSHPQGEERLLPKESPEAQKEAVAEPSPPHAKPHSSPQGADQSSTGDADAGAMMGATDGLSPPAAPSPSAAVAASATFAATTANAAPTKPAPPSEQFVSVTTPSTSPARPPAFGMTSGSFGHRPESLAGALSSSTLGDPHAAVLSALPQVESVASSPAHRAFPARVGLSDIYGKGASSGSSSFYNESLAERVISASHNASPRPPQRPVLGSFNTSGDSGRGGRRLGRGTGTLSRGNSAVLSPRTPRTPPPGSPARGGGADPTPDGGRPKEGEASQPTGKPPQPGPSDVSVTSSLVSPEGSASGRPQPGLSIAERLSARRQAEAAAMSHSQIMMQAMGMSLDPTSAAIGAEALDEQSVSSSQGGQSVVSPLPVGPHGGRGKRVPPFLAYGEDGNGMKPGLQRLGSGTGGRVSALASIGSDVFAGSGGRGSGSLSGGGVGAKLAARKASMSNGGPPRLPTAASRGALRSRRKFRPLPKHDELVALRYSVAAMAVTALRRALVCAIGQPVPLPHNLLAEEIPGACDRMLPLPAVVALHRRVVCAVRRARSIWLRGPSDSRAFSGHFPCGPRLTSTGRLVSSVEPPMSQSDTHDGEKTNVRPDEPLSSPLSSTAFGPIPRRTLSPLDEEANAVRSPLLSHRVESQLITGASNAALSPSGVCSPVGPPLGIDARRASLAPTRVREATFRESPLPPSQVPFVKISDLVDSIQPLTEFIRPAADGLLTLPAPPTAALYAHGRVVLPLRVMAVVASIKGTRATMDDSHCVVPYPIALLQHGFHTHVQAYASSGFGSSVGGGGSAVHPSTLQAGRPSEDGVFGAAARSSGASSDDERNACTHSFTDRTVDPYKCDGDVCTYLDSVDPDEVYEATDEVHVPRSSEQGLALFCLGRHFGDTTEGFCDVELPHRSADSPSDSGPLRHPGWRRAVTICRPSQCSNCSLVEPPGDSPSPLGKPIADAPCRGKVVGFAATAIVTFAAIFDGHGSPAFSRYARYAAPLHFTEHLTRPLVAAADGDEVAAEGQSHRKRCKAWPGKISDIASEGAGGEGAENHDAACDEQGDEGDVDASFTTFNPAKVNICVCRAMRETILTLHRDGRVHAQLVDGKPAGPLMLSTDSLPGAFGSGPLRVTAAAVGADGVTDSVPTSPTGSTVPGRGDGARASQPPSARPQRGPSGDVPLPGIEPTIENLDDTVLSVGTTSRPCTPPLAAKVPPLPPHTLSSGPGAGLTPTVWGTTALMASVHLAAPVDDGYVVPEHAPDGFAEVLAAAKERHILTIANLGDSQAVASIGGTALCLTRRHNVVSKLEADRVKARGGEIIWKDNAYRVQGYLSVTRAIGDYEIEKDLSRTPDIVEMDVLAAGLEFVVLGSDGFWGTWQPQAAIDCIRPKLAGYYGVRGVVVGLRCALHAYSPRCSYIYQCGVLLLSPSALCIWLRFALQLDGPEKGSPVDVSALLKELFDASDRSDNVTVMIMIFKHGRFVELLSNQ